MLVSAQAAPNLLAAAEPELKPARAALVVSAAMQPRADPLAKVLRELGIEVEQHRLANEHDPKAIEDSLLDWFQTLPAEVTYLNVTGGTKLMALAALSVAEAAGWRSFYVDVDTDRVVWLGRSAPPAHKLKERVGLRHYLGAYGIEIEGEILRGDASKPQQAFIEELFSDNAALQALPALYRALDRAEAQGALEVELLKQERDFQPLRSLLEFAAGQGLVSLQGQRLRVSDEAARDFLKGGWLERHVFATVTRLQRTLDMRDRAFNLKVRQWGVGNEMDVAFLFRNRLHVIECKTGNMGVDDGKRANEALFKLAENGRRLGGLATRAMFVSLRTLGDAEMRLARLLQIEVVHGRRDLRRLGERLHNWCRPR